MNNEFIQLLAKPEGVMIVLGLAALAVNVFSYNLYRNLLNLVLSEAATRQELIGENVASLYAKYLFCQLMTGKFFRPNMQMFGCPELDPIVSSIKRSTAYLQASKDAVVVRNVPFNFIPYFV